MYSVLMVLLQKVRTTDPCVYVTVYYEYCITNLDNRYYCQKICGESITHELRMLIFYQFLCGSIRFRHDDVIK